MEISLEQMCRAKGISGTILIEMERKDITQVHIAKELNKTKQAVNKQLHKANDKYSEREPSKNWAKSTNRKLAEGGIKA